MRGVAHGWQRERIDARPGKGQGELGGPWRTRPISSCLVEYVFTAMAGGLRYSLIITARCSVQTTAADYNDDDDDEAEGTPMIFV